MTSKLERDELINLITEALPVEEDEKSTSEQLRELYNQLQAGKTFKLSFPSKKDKDKLRGLLSSLKCRIDKMCVEIGFMEKTDKQKLIFTQLPGPEGSVTYRVSLVRREPVRFSILEEGD